MTTYIYSGPPSGVTLNEGDQQREVLLWPGKTVDLTPDNPYTLTLLAMQYLQEQEPARTGNQAIQKEKNNAR
ncbi:hypothetical protein SD351_002529 [Salmonella enterica]|uniref:Gp12 n=1 Tax=Salmonella enterica I TaxID=59201 RepID=A0A403QH44_SALET|nr:hypothetical protein [Salmonella enterica]EAS0615036.1 hypothetical protein [Salmonella enterica subsp. enterica serovar Dahomey]EBQ9004267.1 hypothetical protein [Salmonella enterica subsp. enterica serovar Blockley]EBQ9987898.1 hypothetical protein [Salmonella enterica subsp. enterica serovar Oranienburg]EBU8699386.1 hypothetical protein [Salmonella enterica subsp. enterica serovar Kokomlemle]EBW2603652.1 hypothetical protein [Salmonella enterica subsp. enterica serovar Poano]EBY7079490.